MLSIPLRLRMAIDVAEGMAYLHSRNPPIIHRDLKSHNLFVQELSDGQFAVKIGDWGSARAMALSRDGGGGHGRSPSKSMTQGIGTVCWLAPEVIKHGKGSERIDVYSFGIVLWELATREEVSLSVCRSVSQSVSQSVSPNGDCAAVIITNAWYFLFNHPVCVFCHALVVRSIDRSGVPVADGGADHRPRGE